MQFKKILCPVDFSPANREAIHYAGVLAQAFHAELVLLHVVAPTSPYGSWISSEAQLSFAEERTRLEKLARPFRDLSVHCKILHGAPASEILHYAGDHQVDLIVMGTHGRTGLQRALLGSVAESIVRRSHCPVLTLKPGTSDQESTS